MNPLENKFNSLLSYHRQLAPTASIKVSPLCLGCMTFGEKQQERYGRVSKDEAFAILDHFYDNGGSFLDTANVYQYGQSEQWIGEWMDKRQNRDELVIATKFTAPTMPQAKIRTNYQGNSTKAMRIGLEASLRNLNTSYIDIFYVHMWDYTTTITELMHALNDLVASGKVNYLGISDTPAWVVSKANQYARDHGLRQFVVYQGAWSAALRDFERDIIPMARDEGMALAPYGVLGQGRFQTEQGYRDREKNPEGRNFIPVSQKDKDISKHLEKIAARKGCSLLDVALAYVRFKSVYVFPIVGGRKVEHIKGSMAALEVKLTEQDIEEIEEGYSFDPGFPHTFLTGTMFNPEAKPKGAQFPQDIWQSKAAGSVEWVAPEKPIGMA